MPQIVLFDDMDTWTDIESALVATVSQDDFDALVGGARLPHELGRSPRLVQVLSDAKHLRAMVEEILRKREGLTAEQICDALREVVDQTRVIP
jgi:hypothetical protein